VKKIAIFASGNGTNAAKIIQGPGGRRSSHYEVSLIVTNNPKAGVLKIASTENIRCLVVEKERFFRGDAYVNEIMQKAPDLIVLAGFLWKIPLTLIQAYPRKIINIHPALLPAYGGKGMYGIRVHQAVMEGKEKESGITIHYVDEHYDNGDIILQVKCPVNADDDPETLAKRVLVLEHKYYPMVVDQLST
jgi:phosphoribosylglycinamide formyltransferase 1